MKTVSVEFVERVKLNGIIGSATGTIAKITALQAIYQQVLFTEDEQKELTFTEQPGGGTVISAPSAEFGKKTFTVEDQHAKILSDEINNWQGCTLADLDWIKNLQSQLT